MSYKDIRHNGFQTSAIISHLSVLIKNKNGRDNDGIRVTVNLIVITAKFGARIYQNFSDGPSPKIVDRICHIASQ